MSCWRGVLSARHDRVRIRVRAEPPLVGVFPNIRVVRHFCAVVGCGRRATYAWEGLTLVVEVVMRPHLMRKGVVVGRGHCV